MRLKEKHQSFDILINNAGVYHLPPNKSVDGLDITFATNTVGCLYLLEQMVPLVKENGVIVATSSMSQNFYHLNYENLSLDGYRNKLKKYSLSKRTMLEAFQYIKQTTNRKDISWNLVHPGICATELFNKSHGKFFMTFLFPLMKIIFHSPKIASTSLVLGCFVKTKQNEWVGPRGLNGGWGYSKILKLKKKTWIRCEEVYSYVNSFYPKA